MTLRRLRNRVPREVIFLFFFFPFRSRVSVAIRLFFAGYRCPPDETHDLVPYDDFRASDRNIYKSFRDERSMMGIMNVGSRRRVNDLYVVIIGSTVSDLIAI